VTVNYATTFTAETTGGTWTLSGAMKLNAALTVDGPGNTVLGGAISSGSEAWQPGLLEGRFTGGTIGTSGLFDETFPNTGTGGVKMTPSAGETASTPPWSDYTGYVYTGQIYDADGVFTLAENVDDYVEIKIDGITRLRNTSASTPSTTGSGGASDNPYANVNSSFNYGMGANGDGWHDIEIRFYNLVGGAGAVGNNFWSTLKGFGIDRDSINPLNVGNAYAVPNETTMSPLFRTRVSTGNALAKSGSGTLTLNGVNTYTGPTTLAEGKLVLNGTTGTGAVTVQAGTTLSGNNGTIQGPLTVYGTIAPGGANPGTLTVNADATLAAGAIFPPNINGVIAGTQYDQLIVNGQVQLDHPSLQPLIGYVPAGSDRYVLVANDGTEPIVGEFAGYANHSIVTIGTLQYRIFYDGGDGNDVVLVRTAPLAVNTIRYDAGDTDVGNGKQRSVVSRIVVTFNGLVENAATLDPAALQVERVISWGDLQQVGVQYTSEQVGEATQLILTFTGEDIYSYQRPAGSGEYSLNDGNYRLTIEKDLLTSATGAMAEDKVDDFFRWFGDSDGDRYTSGTDMFAIRRVMVNDPDYAARKAGFDYNGDDAVNNTDYNQFRVRYGRRLLPPS
jgi:autotransporter-associated beta strand protein